MVDLIFIKKFKRQGKQGIVGIVKDKKTNQLYIYKVPQFNNYLSRHEYITMNTLYHLRHCCPHYCKPVHLLTKKVDTKYNRKDNLFKRETTEHMNVELLLMEHLPYKNLYDCISNKNVSNDILYSTIKMVLIATQISQLKCSFTHYDLHSGNILTNIRMLSQDYRFWVFILQWIRKPTHLFIFSTYRSWIFNKSI